MKMRVFLLIVFFLSFGSFFPSSAHAVTGCLQTGPKGECTTVSTAIGNINTDIGSLVGNVLQIIIGVAGGVAVLLIIAAGYQMMASQGNPEKVKEARERLTSAIVGLLFIFFSVTVLQIIGIDILHIPGFITR